MNCPNCTHEITPEYCCYNCGHRWGAALSEAMREKPVMHNCPYDSVVQCALIEPCLNCEVFREYVKDK